MRVAAVRLRPRRRRAGRVPGRRRAALDRAHRRRTSSTASAAPGARRTSSTGATPLSATAFDRGGRRARDTHASPSPTRVAPRRSLTPPPALEPAPAPAPPPPVVEPAPAPGPGAAAGRARPPLPDPSRPRPTLRPLPDPARCPTRRRRRSTPCVFLSPTGNDAANCSAAAPCRTLDRGYHAAAPGRGGAAGRGHLPRRRRSPTTPPRTAPARAWCWPRPPARR